MIEAELFDKKKKGDRKKLTRVQEGVDRPEGQTGMLYQYRVHWQ